VDVTAANPSRSEVVVNDFSGIEMALLLRRPGALTWGVANLGLFLAVAVDTVFAFLYGPFALFFAVFALILLPTAVPAVVCYLALFRLLIAKPVTVHPRLLAIAIAPVIPLGWAPFGHWLLPLPGVLPFTSIPPVGVVAAIGLLFALVVQDPEPAETRPATS
jgi:hypothetical protein